MEVFISKLLDLYQKRQKSQEDLVNLRNFVEDLQSEQIESLMSERIEYNDGPRIVFALLEGLSQKNTSQKKRIKLIEQLLDCFQNKNVPETNISTIICWLGDELHKLSNTHLVRLSDYCVNLVGSSKDAKHTSWKDLLPQVLNLIASKKEVDHFGSDITGEQYKSQVIGSLLQAEWDSTIVSSLAAMFTHITLSVDEHRQIVTKLCSQIDRLSPEELPPLIHQLLSLTLNQHAMIVFFSLKLYYKKKLYSTNESQDEVIESASKNDILDSQSMVLYHVRDRASTYGSRTSISQQIINCAKISINTPEVFLDPFLLSVLLTISSLPTYEEQVIDIVKNTIIRVVLEDEKRSESDWLRKLTPTECFIEVVMKQFISSRACGQDSVLKGLVSLGMALLRAFILGKPKLSRKVWYFGRMILVNTVKHFSFVIGGVLPHLINTILHRPDLPQAAECLGEICESSPLLVAEHSKLLSSLIDALPNLTGTTGLKVTAALVSLVRISGRLRDNIILVLRKSLFMHNLNARKLAVFGLLQILKKLKISNLNSLSQNSFQLYTCSTLLSQTVDVEPMQGPESSRSNSNEGICLEVIGVLKRCLTQQADIKISLFQGLSRALVQNPELCVPVSSILLNLLGEYFEFESDVLPPLNFDKAVVIRGADVVVQEPLGYLLCVLQQVISIGKTLPSFDDDEFYTNQSKLDEIMSLLVERFSSCDLKHFDLEADFDNSPESRQREEKLKEALLVYQAVMSYILSSWDVSTTKDGPKQFLTVYRAYNNLLDFAKGVGKKKEKESTVRRGSKDKTLTTQSSQATKRVTPFTIPETVLDFESVYKFVSLLLCDEVPWVLDEVANELKSKKSVLKYSLTCCLEVVHKTKAQLNEGISKSVLKDCTQMAKLLYECCLCKFESLMESDVHSAVLGFECFVELFSLVVTYFGKYLSSFLSSITGIDEYEGLSIQLEKLIKLYLKTFSKSIDDEEDDPENTHAKKLTSVLAEGVRALALQLPVDQNLISKVLKWLKDLVEQKPLKSIQTVRVVMTLLLDLMARCKSDSSVYDNIALQLCDLFGCITDEEVEKSTVLLAAISSSSKIAVLNILCSSLSSRLDCVSWAITRYRSQIEHINQPNYSPSSPKTRKCELKQVEKDIVSELALIVSTCQWITTCAVPASSSEMVCKLIQKVYSTLTQLTKYFVVRSSHQNPVYQEARFSKLVKLSASNLSSQVADFLLYVEAIDDEETTKKPKITQKLLKQAKKQTVYIPKLVAELETFSKCIYQLSGKCKDTDLNAKMKLTTTRDFKLNTKKLEEILTKDDESDYEASSRMDTDETNDENVDANTSQISQASTSGKRSQAKSQNQKRSQPKRKKRKT